MGVYSAIGKLAALSQLLPNSARSMCVKDAFVAAGDFSRRRFIATERFKGLRIVLMAARAARLISAP